MQHFHSLIVKETGIVQSKELSIFTAFLILSSKLPSIQKILLSEVPQSILFYTILIYFLLKFNIFFQKSLDFHSRLF